MPRSGLWSIGLLALHTLVGLSGCGASESRPGSGAADPPADAAGGAAAAGDEAPLSPLIAEVNGRPLYTASYDQVLEFIRERLPSGQEANNVERFVGAKFDALELLVNDELIHQEAARQGIAPTEKELMEEFRRTAASAGGEEVFLAAMRARKLRRQDVLEAMKRKLAVDRYMKEKVVPAVKYTEEEVTAFYNQNLERFTPTEWVKTYQILIRCPRSAPADQAERARKRAETILANIRAGEPFEIQAREYSEDASAALSGNMGFMKRGVASPEYDAVAFSIAPGRVSDVFRSDLGFHIIKVAERRGGEPASLEKVREEVRKVMHSRGQASLLKSIVTRLREDAKIVTYLD